MRSSIAAEPQITKEIALRWMLVEREVQRDEEEPAFYYHTDHLGSTAYLTYQSSVIQTLNYLPYGEDWVEHNFFNSIDTTRLGIYRFNGKEKDYESGFHYYGARYYWGEILTGWLSVDPLADKYPSVSPYAYCNWNPVLLVDPDGMKFDSASVKYVEMYRESINSRINRDPNNKQQYDKALNELTTLEMSSQVYHINNKRPSARVGGETGFNYEQNYVEINADIDGTMSNLAHELKHAYQFECGELSFNMYGGMGALYDFYDERAAFDRTTLFGGRMYSDNEIMAVYKFKSKQNLSIGSLDKSSFAGYNKDATFRETFMSPYYNNNKQVFRYDGNTIYGKKRL